MGIGGWDPQILIGQRVDVTTKDGVVPGVIGKKPIHLLKEDERKKAADMKDLHIDIGAKDGDEAKALVRVGDVAVIAGEPVELPNDRVVARAMDNRLGCYVALEAARLVAEAGDAAWDVVAAVAVQEEIDLRRPGARARAAPGRRDRRRRDPRDRRPRGRPEADQHPPVRLGRGHRARRDPQPEGLRAAERDRRGRGDPVHASASGRSTGTDADVFHLSRGGVPGGISLPLRYMHSPVEMVQLDDVAHARSSWRPSRRA